MFLTVSNPGSRTGAFVGTQLFESTIKVDTSDPLLPFVYSGTITFTGTVPACYGEEEGTVIFHNEGTGDFVNGVATNHQTTVHKAGTLRVSADLDLFALTPGGPGIEGTNEITGEFSCNNRNRDLGHHGNRGSHHGHGRGHNGRS